MTVRLVDNDELIGLTIKPKTFERIEAQKKLNLAAKPSFTAERALIYTRVYKETEGEPAVIRRAKALAATLREIKIDITPYELLVGRESIATRCTQAYPEIWGEDFYQGFDNIRDREKMSLQMTEEDEKALVEVVWPYWKGKSLGSLILGLMPQEQKEYWFEDPDAEVPVEMGFTGTVEQFSNNTVDESYTNNYNILQYGFKGMKEIAEKELEKTDISKGFEDIQKSLFQKAVIITYDAVSDFIMRYAALARSKSNAETDTKRKNELEQIAETCEWLAENPARTFREALQAVQFSMVVTKLEVITNAWNLARFDQYMYPFYKKDVDEGIITKDEALELIQSMWVKCSDFVIPRSENGAEFEGGYANWFNVNVGGVKADGSDAVNELSYLCLDATAGLRLYQPDICVRTHRDSPDEFIKYALEVNAICPTIKFYNDDAIIPAILTLSEGKMPLEDARGYSNMACVEAAVVEKVSFSNTTSFGNIAAAVELTLNNGISRMLNRRFGPETGDPRNFKSMDEFVDAFRTQFRHMTKMVCAANNLGDQIHLRNIYLPFISGSRVDLIERGVCMTGDMDKSGDSPYDYNFFVLTGFGDGAESFNVVNDLVFEKKKITMAELVDALDNDFEGPHERIRNMIKYDVPHYGNDIESADRWAELVTRIISEETYEYYKTSTGHLCHPNLQSVTMNVGYGTATGALPTGKKAGEPIADASGPISGFDTEGPTACANSVADACCRASHDIGKPNLNLFNLRISKDMIHGEGGIDNWAALVRAYFEAGGTHVQFNVEDSETLKDAQTNPKEHRNLMVRVAGYAAYFTELPKGVQDDIIDRTEYDTGW